MIRGESRAADGQSALAAVGLNEQDDQEDGRHQNKQQAGHEAEIVGFHERERTCWNVSPSGKL